MRKLFILLFIICSGLGLAIVSKFTSWDNLISGSSDIIVIKCLEPRTTNSITGVAINSRILVVDILKGQTNLNGTSIYSDERLKKDEYYLAFANFSDGAYTAYKQYPFVPIYGQYAKERFPGKDVKERVNAILRQRLEWLKIQIPREQAEKERLGQAFK